MSKLSASHLFDAMRSFTGGPAVGKRHPKAPLSAEKLASFLDGHSPPRAIQLTTSDVACAIRQTFDIETDQIVADPGFLLDLPTVPAGRRWRFDAAHAITERSDDRREPGQHPSEQGAALADRACTAAEDLATALGVVQARELLQRTNWIVAVVDADPELSPACEPHLTRLAKQRRMLIVWCEPSGASGSDTNAASPMLEGMLSRCGLAHLGPLNGLSVEELTTVFGALKGLGQACLVRLRVRQEEESQRGPSLAPNTFAAGHDKAGGRESAKTHRPHLESGHGVSVAAVEAAVAKIAADEPGTVVVDLRVPEVAEEFRTWPGDRYLAVGQDDPHLWQWCAGLVAGGCRPVFLVSEAHWFSAAAAMAGLPDGIHLRATLIVVGNSGPASRRHNHSMAFMREAVVCAASDLSDFERLLSYSFSQDGLTMIWAPIETCPAGSRRKVRLDRAASPWLQRQHRAGRVEHRRIIARQYSAELAPWIAAYEQVGQRNGYIWKWCLHGVELTTLSCVPPSLRGDACDTKVLMGMFNVLVDDIGDRHTNAELLSAFRTLVHNGEAEFSRFSGIERRYGEFTRDVWQEIWRRAKRYPCYDPYARLLEFDLIQLFNTVHYSQLVNSNPYILNVVEHDDYSPQGMGLQSFAMIDLMCSPEFVANELGKLREAMWHAQWMARIGNLITTWQREMADRDYTSGVFAHALAKHDLTVEELVSGSPTQIADAIYRGGHEAWFLRRWRQHRARMRRLFDDVRSVDLRTMLRGLERLLRTELVSRGEK